MSSYSDFLALRAQKEKDRLKKFKRYNKSLNKNSKAFKASVTTKKRVSDSNSKPEGVTRRFWEAHLNAVRKQAKANRNTSVNKKLGERVKILVKGKEPFPTETSHDGNKKIVSQQRNSLDNPYKPAINPARGIVNGSVGRKKTLEWNEQNAYKLSMSIHGHGKKHVNSGIDRGALK